MSAKFSAIAAILAALYVTPVSRADDAIEKLLAMMPSDAGIVIVVERPQRALPPTLIEPVLKALAPDEKTAAQLLDALKKVPGPFVIGLVPRVGVDFGNDPGAIMAMAIERPDLSFEDWYETHFFPAVQAMSDDANRVRLRVERGEGTIRVLERPGDAMVFGFAVKDRIAFGASKANRVLRWRKGAYPKESFLSVPGVRRLLKSLPKESNARVLVNPQALVEALPKSKDPMEGLALQVFAPTEIEAGAIDMTWERRTIRIRATAALAEECKGLARILTQPSTECRQIGIFPDDFAVVGRLGWSSAQGVMDGIYALTDLFDETISTEHREDLATFESQTGVDWDGDVLGQLVGEVAFGVRVDFTRKNPFGWATVLPLGDRAAFSKEIEQLISFYELPVEEKEKDGVMIRGGESMPISFAVTSDVFVVADSPETILDLAKRAGRENREPAGKSLRASFAKMERPNQVAVLLDLETLMKKAPILAMGAGPKLGPIISRGTVSLSIWSKERTATAELVWDMGRPMDRGSTEKGEDAALIALVEVATESLGHARREALRVVSMSNMRGVGQAIYIYAADRKGAFPESLEEMLRAAPNTITLDSFRCPYDGMGPKSFDELTEKSYLVYRPGLNQNSPPDEIVLAEKATYDNNGANFLFVDGHVEFIPEPRASQLIELIKGGAASVKR